MSGATGYAMVDADHDDDERNRSRSGAGAGGGLEFQSFLPTSQPSLSSSSFAQQPSSSPYPNSSPNPNPNSTQPSVPFSLFNLTYYQSYFDVDTKTVLNRCLQACVPRGGFVNDVCEERIDLYGPFWTLTTLIFTLYLSASLSTTISAYLSSEPVVQDLTLLSAIVTLIYTYGIGFPALFWAATKYLFGSGYDGHQGGEWSVVEALGVWGYGMTPFVPVSILCIIPVPILRWVLVGAATASSGYFLVRNVYPVLAAHPDNKKPRYLIIAVVVVHAAIALTMKIMFFSYSVGGKSYGPDDPLYGGIVGGKTEAR